MNFKLSVKTRAPSSPASCGGKFQAATGDDEGFRPGATSQSSVDDSNAIGNIIPMTIQGTYTANPDCTGSRTCNVSSGVPDKKIQPDSWPRFRTASLLGESLAGQKKYAEAKPLRNANWLLRGHI